MRVLSNVAGPPVKLTGLPVQVTGHTVQVTGLQVDLTGRLETTRRPLLVWDGSLFRVYGTSR